ncbi:MAG: hypothetical protein IJT14_02990 [Rickettsiales bacterium]|nr:hypothetical protein [Rickettsiales bacterium]
MGWFRKKNYNPDDIMSNGQKYLAKQLADEVERLKQSVETICELVKSGEKIDRRIALEDAKRVIRLLDKGAIKIAEQVDENKWQVNEWIKSAISLLFLEQNRAIAGFGATSSMTWFDKIGNKFDGWSSATFMSLNIRVVPGSIVRQGVYIGQNSDIMLSFINVGSYIGDGTKTGCMTSIGFGTYIGNQCCICDNVCLGENANPMTTPQIIIEDDCLIKSGCIIERNIIVGRGSILENGVILSHDTKIIDYATGREIVDKIPNNSIVKNGTFKQDKDISLVCAIVFARKNNNDNVTNNLDNVVDEDV